MNCFGFPDYAADVEETCRYTGKIVNNKGVLDMALVSPKDDLDTVKRRIVENKLIGYKPCLGFVEVIFKLGILF